VVASNFHLKYTDLGSGKLGATITGDNSFIRLSDQTYRRVPGSISARLKFDTGSTSTFDFTAIGLSGTFSYDSTGDYTGGTATSATGFSANAMSKGPVPEQTTLALGGIGSLMLAGYTWRRRRRAKLA
jgi:hypothetical protein